MDVIHKITSLLFLLLSLGLFAQNTDMSVIELQSGGKIVGKILYQNEEMVVVRTEEGSRYQYMMQDVKLISPFTGETVEVEQKQQRKAGVMVEATGAGAVLRGDKNGGFFGVSVSVGAINLLNRHWFLGGGFAVNDFIMKRQTLNEEFVIKESRKSMLFVPIFINTALPLMQGKHAPFVAAALGYGFSTKKAAKGGLYASADLGYRVQLNDYNALFVGFNWSMQQSRFDNVETNGNDFFAVNRTHTLHSLGVKIAVVL